MTFLKHSRGFGQIALTLLLTGLTCSAVAQVFDYQIKEDNTIVITGFQGGVANLVIPSVIDEWTVTEIGEGAFRQLQREFRGCASR